MPRMSSMAQVKFENQSSDNSPRPLSPVKNTLRPKRLVKMLVRRFSVVNFDIDSSEGGHGGDAEKGGEVKYLPMPRTRANPNARGGAIAILPKAPTDRLDYYSSPTKKEKVYSLNDLMIDLGLIDAPRVGQGRNAAPKKISKQQVEQYITAIFKA